MKFIQLTYPSGREFLVNAAVIAGVEVNGTEDNGCVLTLTLTEWDPERGVSVNKFEVVKETFSEISRCLWNSDLMAVG